jgi:hypothetical protein
MKKWLAILALLILGLVLGVIPASADTSAEVTVTATGWVCGAPGGFTITYISDYEVGLSWAKGAGAVNTMVRAAYGRMPESREDGYLVYYGDREYCSDTAVSLDETATPVYYRAWSQNIGGAWEEGETTGFIEGIGVTMIAFIVLALGIVGIAMWKKHLLLYLVAFIGLILIASHLIDTSLILGIPLYLLSGYMMWEFATWFF